MGNVSHAIREIPLRWSKVIGHTMFMAKHGMSLFIIIVIIIIIIIIIIIPYTDQ